MNVVYQLLANVHIKNESLIMQSLALALFNKLC